MRSDQYVSKIVSPSAIGPPAFAGAGIIPGDPRPTNPPCIGSCPLPPPGHHRHLPATGTVRPGDEVRPEVDAEHAQDHAAIPHSASAVTSSGELISFFIGTPVNPGPWSPSAESSAKAATPGNRGSDRRLDPGPVTRMHRRDRRSGQNRHWARWARWARLSRIGGAWGITLEPARRPTQAIRRFGSQPWHPIAARSLFAAHLGQVARPCHRSPRFGLKTHLAKLTKLSKIGAGEAGTAVPVVLSCLFRAVAVPAQRDVSIRVVAPTVPPSSEESFTSL